MGDEEADPGNGTTTEETSIHVCDQQVRRLTRVRKPPKYLDNKANFNVYKLYQFDLFSISSVHNVMLVLTYVNMLKTK